MSLREDLYELERALGDGDGDTYREHLTEDAVVVVPGRAMTKEETAAAMDASPGWDESSFDDGRFVQIGDDTALLSYCFSGRRGEDFQYSALIGSVYVQREGAWKMAFHQQTPLT
jgi:hypothetical protein